MLLGSVTLIRHTSDRPLHQRRSLRLTAPTYRRAPSCCSAAHRRRCPRCGGCSDAGSSTTSRAPWARIERRNTGSRSVRARPHHAAARSDHLGHRALPIQLLKARPRHTARRALRVRPVQPRRCTTATGPCSASATHRSAVKPGHRRAERRVVRIHCEDCPCPQRVLGHPATPPTVPHAPSNRE